MEKLSLLITAIFFLIKNLGYINWSYWWIFSPLIICTAINIVSMEIATLIISYITTTCNIQFQPVDEDGNPIE